MQISGLGYASGGNSNFRTGFEEALEKPTRHQSDHPKAGTTTGRRAPVSSFGQRRFRQWLVDAYRFSPEDRNVTNTFVSHGANSAFRQYISVNAQFFQFGESASEGSTSSDNVSGQGCP